MGNNNKKSFYIYCLNKNIIKMHFKMHQLAYFSPEEHALEPLTDSQLPTLNMVLCAVHFRKKYEQIEF